MQDLTREQARRVIDRVGGDGQPPEYGFQFFTAGLDAYCDVLSKEYLETFIADGGSAFKMVVGTYGGGKTHFLYTVRELAWANRFVAAHVDLSPEETPFHRLELVYRSIAMNITPPLEPAEILSGYERGMESFLRRWFSQKYQELQAAGVSGDRLKEELNTYAATLKGSESVSFRKAVKEAFLSLADRREEDFSNVVQWLLGEGYDRRVHGRLGILQRIDKSTAFSMIRSLAQWVCEIGYAGLVVLFDEAERIPSLTSKQRDLLLNNLRELIDECGQATLNRTLFFYAVPDEHFLEGRTQIYEALRQRLATEFDEVNPSGVKIYLEKTGGDPVPTLVEIGSKLAAIYETAYSPSWARAELTQATSALASAAYEQRFGDIGYKRLFVQKFIQACHRFRHTGSVPSPKDLGLTAVTP
jgi:hypothetical protein